MKDWKDFPRKKDQVAIVGFSPTTRHLAPYDSPDHEIFILNEEYNFEWCKRFDRLFQIHQRWDFFRSNNMNHANHPLWLRNESGPCNLCKGTGQVTPMFGDKIPVQCPECKGTLTYTPNRRTDFPIYMQQEFDDIPGSVRFPREEADAFLGRKYYRSGFSYMIALAMMMGYKRIEMYGFEMGSNSEYHYQKPNAEWLMGLAQGKGFDLYIPEQCTLLSGPVYGYEDSRIGYRQNLETRGTVLDNQIRKQKTIAEKAEAEVELLQRMLLNPERSVEDWLVETTKKFNTQMGMLNFVRGARTETENLTKMYDKYFTGPSEQEDPIAYNYRIVEENVKVEYAAEK